MLLQHTHTYTHTHTHIHTNTNTPIHLMSALMRFFMRIFHVLQSIIAGGKVTNSSLPRYASSSSILMSLCPSVTWLTIRHRPHAFAWNSSFTFWSKWVCLAKRVSIDLVFTSPPTYRISHMDHTLTRPCLLNYPSPRGMGHLREAHIEQMSRG